MPLTVLIIVTIIILIPIDDVQLIQIFRILIQPIQIGGAEIAVILCQIPISNILTLIKTRNRNFVNNRIPLS